jgi:hypothetical protein
MPQGEKKITDCKGSAQLMLCLYVEGEGGKHEPLCRELGWNGRFRFATASGYNPIGIVAALDAAANRCEGKIHLIRGTLSFGMKRRRIEGGPVVVGQVGFSLSEEDIAAREREIHREKMEREGRVLQYAAPRQSPMLGMDVRPEPVIDTTAELAASAFAAEVSNPPWPEQAGDDGEPCEDDIPFGDDPETEPAEFAQEVRVADATPGQLVDALTRYCQECAREEGEQFDISWKRVTAIETAKGPWSPPSPDWFLTASSEEQGRRRHEALRRICHDLEENDIRFDLRPLATAAVG